MAQILTFRGEVFPPPSGISLTLPVPVFWFFCCFCFVFRLVFCRPFVCFASFAELGPFLSPCLSFSYHTCPHQLCTSFLFLFCFVFIFAFPGFIYRLMWVLLLVFLASFQMGFCFVTTGRSFEIGLCENSINQSIISNIQHSISN